MKRDADWGFKLVQYRKGLLRLCATRTLRAQLTPVSSVAIDIAVIVDEVMSISVPVADLVRL